MKKIYIENFQAKLKAFAKGGERCFHKSLFLYRTFDSSCVRTIEISVKTAPIIIATKLNRFDVIVKTATLVKSQYGSVNTGEVTLISKKVELNG